jgi:hypothetical protein
MAGTTSRYLLLKDVENGEVVLEGSGGNAFSFEYCT